MGMLVLTRKVSQTVNVRLATGEKLEVQILNVRGRQVRLGFIGSRDTFVVEREELLTGKGEGDGEVERRAEARAAGEDRESHGPDEAPSESLLPDEKA